MMRFANQMTLKVRITCGIVLLMLAALALIAAAEWLDAEARKECIISEHLHQEKDRIQRAMQQGKSPVMADDYQLYDMRNVAESFRHYGVGYHKVDGSRWHLLVFDIQGQPYFLVALLHKSAIGQDIPNPKWIYAAATVWGVPSAVN
jgi:hypothetical protein